VHALRQPRPLQGLTPVPAATAKGEHTFDAVVIGSRVVEDLADEAQASASSV
jgi:hypothetical protein